MSHYRIAPSRGARLPGTVENVPLSFYQCFGYGSDQGQHQPAVQGHPDQLKRNIIINLFFYSVHKNNIQIPQTWSIWD